MKAVLIDPIGKKVSSIVLDSPEQVAEVIGFDTIIADAIDDSSDHLYFDGDCFIRGTQGRFQLDTLPPVAGKAIVLGSGPGAVFKSPELTLASLQDRVRFIG